MVVSPGARSRFRSVLAHHSGSRRRQSGHRRRRRRPEKGPLVPPVSLPGSLDVDVPAPAPVQPPAFPSQLPVVLDGRHGRFDVIVVVVVALGKCGSGARRRSRGAAPTIGLGNAVVRSADRTLDGGDGLAFRTTVPVFPLHAENQDVPPLLRCEPELVEGYGVPVMMEGFVLVHLEGFLRFVVPSQLDGTAL